jgi:hypothetical protein
MGKLLRVSKLEKFIEDQLINTNAILGDRAKNFSKDYLWDNQYQNQLLGRRSVLEEVKEILEGEDNV